MTAAGVVDWLLDGERATGGSAAVQDARRSGTAPDPRMAEAVALRVLAWWDRGAKITG